MFNKRFLYSANDFYIQQEIYILSNLKLMFSNIRYIFNSLRFVFNEMEFIELKSFTFSKPRLNVTKKAFCRTKDLVCKLYMSSVSIFSLFSSVLCLLQRWCSRAKFCVPFTSLLVNELCQRLSWGWGLGHNNVDIHKVFVWI